MPDTLLLFFLLLVAVVAGWVSATWQSHRRAQHDKRLANQYFKGLNYLLNEEPDKAIEIFLKLAERRSDLGFSISRQTSREVIDTHLALGSLFRRRGEMDKAIRFHKHIIAQPHLTESQRNQALRELGRDYLQAGLLDRAERLFSELVDREPGDDQPARQLLDIFQQEKDWSKAITQAEELQSNEPAEARILLAQFYCELSDQALSRGDLEQAEHYVSHARRYCPEHARPTMIAGHLAFRRAQYDEARQAYMAACECDHEAFVLVEQALTQCFEALEDSTGFEAWLETWVEKHPMSAPWIRLAELRAKRSPHEGVETLLRGLESHPTIHGLEALVALLHDHEMTLAEVSPDLIGALMSQLRAAQPRYRCRQCGFSSGEHHWLCPSCRQWDTTRLVLGPWGE